MKFIVIGASGFIGEHILGYITSRGFEAIGTRYKNPRPGLVFFNVAEHRIKERINPRFFETDKPVFGIICSAITQIDRCLRERDLSYRVNAESAVRLINDMKSLNIKPIFISTDNVYDGTRGYYTEKDEPNPINEYGRQKLEVERHIQRSVPDGIILRLSKIVGDDPLGHHMLSEWYKLIRENKPIVCIEGQAFSPTLVNDIARAVTSACEKNLRGLYHTANTERFSRAELARLFLAALEEGKTSIVCKPQKDFNFADRRAEKTCLNSEKFIKTTGMQFTPMQEVCKSFVKNLKLTAERTGL